MSSIHSVTDAPANLDSKSLATETFLNWQSQADPAEVVQQKVVLKSLENSDRATFI